jgi:peptidoglycan/xylan/chitin deacetylase (PgdA/CDA1 family)
MSAEQKSMSRRDFLKNAGLVGAGLFIASSVLRISPVEAIEQHVAKAKVADVFYRGDTGTKAAYLTVDDGDFPDEMERVLFVAKEQGAGLTFFPKGNNVDSNPKLYERALIEGHSIQNHTYTHPDFITEKFTEQQIFSEIEKQQKAVKRVAGDDYEQEFFRPPYGQYNDKVIKIATEEFDMKLAIWTTESQGYKTPHAKDPARIDEMAHLATDPASYRLRYPDINQQTLNEIKSTVDNPKDTVNGLISLQHQLPSDIRALPDIIAILKSKGQKLITMPEGLE